MNTIGNFGGLPSAFQSAQLGIKRGLAGLDKDAAAVANSSSGSVDDGASAGLGVSNAGTQVGALVDAQQQKLLTEMSAKALKIADQTLGTLIDTLA